MADFCRTCTIELFGEEFADKNDMVMPSMPDDHVIIGLCEHCGPGWFDNKGNRIDSKDEEKIER